MIEIRSSISQRPPCISCRQRAATRTASALPGTACTRTHHAPAATASAVTATVASSLREKDRG